MKRLLGTPNALGITKYEWYVTSPSGGPTIIKPCTRRRPVNFTPMGVTSIMSGPPHVHPTGALSTCGEPDVTKKNTHPEYITALIRGQGRR